jgi:hypothetical protein
MRKPHQRTRVASSTLCSLSPALLIRQSLGSGSASFSTYQLARYLGKRTALREAQEEGRIDQEAWLVDRLPKSIQEIDLTDCRRKFRLRRAA